MYDSHTHTNNSHDSKCIPYDLCQSAVQKGLSGITITDHCDTEYYIIDNVRSKVLSSIDDAEKMNREFHGKLRVFKGVEIGESIYDEDSTKDVLSLCDYDMVLGSVHAVRLSKHYNPFSQIDFSSWSDEKISEYMSVYFDDMLEMTQSLDFDVLTHITCPLGYINFKYGKNYNYECEMPKIELILKRIIERNLALEVNTSRTALNKDGFMADGKILSLYKKLGGRLITIGSDCHVAENCAFNFDNGLKLIKDAGFDSVCHFENRKPKFTKII